jgi:hypothetical protein
MANKAFSQSDIPDLIEQILPVIKTKIDMLQAKETPSDNDAKLCLSLLTALTSAHLAYRAFRKELKGEAVISGPRTVADMMVAAKEALVIRS